MMFRFRYLFALLAAVAVMGFVVGEADARVGKGGSFGSRGNRTFSAPPPTNTAPNTVSPFQRSTTQPNAARPTNPAGAPTTGMARPGLFGGGLLGGLAAGFLGAGLLGMLFGHGFLGGLGGFASIIGLLLQVVLVVIVARLAWSWWQRRQQQPAYASGPSMRDNPMGNSGMGNSGQSVNGGLNSSMGGGGGLGGMFGGLGGGAAQEEDMGQPIELQGQDYDTFERLLGEVQTAYSDEDLSALRSLATPEMVSYFAEDLADSASRGVINKVSDVKLLQGDLAEAWNEDGTDYATVAMRFGLIDRTLDRKSGQLVEGSEAPMEAVELWTFRRAQGGNWMLAGIQQPE